MGDMRMKIHEVELTEAILAKLIRFSEDWTAENSCYGYRPNERADIEGNRIFVAEDDGDIVGYLFGRSSKSAQMQSVMPEGTPVFEVEELYVVPERRSRGIGEKLFHFAEETLSTEVEYIVLSTATKNWRAIFHFYIEEMDMTFWSARLFKKIGETEKKHDTV